MTGIFSIKWCTLLIRYTIIVVRSLDEPSADKSFAFKLLGFVVVSEGSFAWLLWCYETTAERDLRIQGNKGSNRTQYCSRTKTRFYERHRLRNNTRMTNRYPHTRGVTEVLDGLRCWMDNSAIGKISQNITGCLSNFDLDLSQGAEPVLTYQ
jgi:hypothetical protein